MGDAEASVGGRESYLVLPGGHTLVLPGGRGPGRAKQLVVEVGLSALLGMGAISGFDTLTPADQ
jgi:hypothetical protein